MLRILILLLLTFLGFNNALPQDNTVRQNVERQYEIDSIRFSKALSKALKFANTNKQRKEFTHYFELVPDDSSFIIKTSLRFGNLFSSKYKHLIIRRVAEAGFYFDIFIYQGNSFKNICNRSQEALTYLNDTLRDVNRDGYKDFLFHWYPLSGCCRRDVYNVYLYLPSTGRLSKDYKFINPTFSPSEKIIRGVEYGHPGEVGLYKYKWNKLAVDTIEFIYPDASKKNMFYITSKRDWHRPPIVESKIVTFLPKEYLKIESIEWFLMY